jgi:hypothetical protein
MALPGGFLVEGVPRRLPDEACLGAGGPLVAAPRLLLPGVQVGVGACLGGRRSNNSSLSGGGLPRGVAQEGREYWGAIIHLLPRSPNRVGRLIIRSPLQGKGRGGQG